MPDHDHDDLIDLINVLGERIDDLASRMYRVEDATRDAGYRADEAKRAADDAARSSQRGW